MVVCSQRLGGMKEENKRLIVNASSYLNKTEHSRGGLSLDHFVKALIITRKVEGKRRDFKRMIPYYAIPSPKKRQTNGNARYEINHSFTQYIERYWLKRGKFVKGVVL